MSVILRPATIKDLDKILEIVNHSILHTTANYSYDIQTLEVQTKWFEDKKSALKYAKDAKTIAKEMNWNSKDVDVLLAELNNK